MVTTFDHIHLLLLLLLLLLTLLLLAYTGLLLVTLCSNLQFSTLKDVLLSFADPVDPRGHGNLYCILEMITTCNHSIIAITVASNILTSNFRPHIAAVAAGNMLISSSMLSIAMVLLLLLLLLIHVTKLFLQHSLLLTLSLSTQ